MTYRTVLAAAALSAAFLHCNLLASPAFAQSKAPQAEAGDAAKGLAYARQVCAECHGVLANEKVSPRFNVATFVRIANIPGMTPLALQVFFQTPHPNMPNLVVEEPDKRNLIAYIVSLKEK